ncbi:SGNH/GDSL hydrolase family protein [Marinibacterium profundimaris]|uniref:SGNH/GDSL hydrolase family protein n=1 Tax=Marinibacterium profundimaris TaxID=1679460 RepID=UPI001E2FFFB5|nr:SGNH/GDSL hydrolase family protein [Marinibacterium profundimaris]
MDQIRTVLCFGDSNTYGSSPMTARGDSFRYRPEIRWPMRMAAALGPGWHVIEEGLPGRTTCHDNPFEGPHKNGLRMLPAILESHAPIDVIVMMLGTNDLKGYLGLTAFDIAKGLRTLLLRIRQSAAGPGGGAPAVVLVSPVPIEECGPTAEGLAGGAEKSRRLTGFCKDLADEFDAAFLDAGSVATVSEQDGVHLDPQAHVALGAAVAEKVACLFARA